MGVEPEDYMVDLFVDDHTVCSVFVCDHGQQFITLPIFPVLVMAAISHKKRACWFVLGILIVWSVLTGVDWYFRFAHYQWGDQFKLEKWLARAQKLNTVDTAVHDPDEQDESREEYVAPQMGGGLSRLLQVSSLRKPFEQARPAYSLSYDRLHYLNAFEYDTNVPIVVVGDSFMTCGGGMDQLFSTQLSRVVGQPVYNAAQAGRGPHLSTYCFLAINSKA